MSDQPDPPRRRRREAQEPAPAAQGSPARGVILVVAAVLIGFALLQDQDSSTAQVAVGADQETATTADDDVADDGDVAESTTTTEAPLPPSDVTVLVANGSEVDGAAGAQSNALEALGYVTADPTNAENVPNTVVYYTPGFQAEAEELAAQIGVDPASVAALPTPAPVPDMQLANILVVLGPDTATAG